MKHDPFYWSKEWRLVRARQLLRRPFCGVCESIGIKTRATEVDHIVARRLGGAFFHVQNLQSLCKTHHLQKTARGPEAGSSQSDKGFTIVGPDGYPVGPDDPEEEERY